MLNSLDINLCRVYGTVHKKVAKVTGNFLLVKSNGFTSTLEKWPISVHRDLEIKLEFERNGLGERYNYSEGSHEPNEVPQVGPRVFELELLVSTLLFLLLSGHSQRFNRKLFFKNTTVQYAAYSKRLIPSLY